MIGCLQHLQQRYAEVGSQLLILRADPRQGIPSLAAALNAKGSVLELGCGAVLARTRSHCSDALKEKGIEFLDHNWDQILHAPEEICTGSNQPYTVYTPVLAQLE
jgi:deoxyribodipyrimidine photo-lyase